MIKNAAPPALLLNAEMNAKMGNTLFFPRHAFEVFGFFFELLGGGAGVAHPVLFVTIHSGCGPQMPGRHPLGVGSLQESQGLQPASAG